jgi:hypothetical protein
MARAFLMICKSWLQPHPHPKLTICEVYKLQHTSSPNAIHSVKVGIRIQAPTNVENQ